MLYLVTALYNEAKPFIDHYQLKKVPHTSKFQVFRHDDMVLVVSGSGAFQSAVATTYVLTRFGHDETSNILNIGIAGAVQKEGPYQEGDPVLCHKIVHHDNGRAYYPDILAEHRMKEGSVETFAYPVGEAVRSDVSADLVDMEGAGFYEAASSFLSPHQIYCVKIVSDFLEPSAVSPQKVTRLVARTLSELEDLIEVARGITAIHRDVLTEEDHRLLKQLAGNLKLSQTLSHQLTQLAKQYRLRTGKPLTGLLDDYTELVIESKHEGKICFEQIKERLLHT